MPECRELEDDVSREFWSLEDGRLGRLDGHGHRCSDMDMG
jgi:hypothetical protein